MLRKWTVNGAELADLGIDNLIVHLANQDEEYVELRFPRNYDARLPDGFEMDAPVIVRYGQKVYFRGEIGQPSRQASPSSEYRSVFVYGPWHRFTQMPFLYLYPYTTGNVPSTHGIIGGNANDMLTAILTTNVSDIIQIGTIDVGSMTIPETEVYDQTLAQALQAVLRYIPGAVVAFDYATDPPTINIVSDDSTSLATVALNVDDTSSNSFRLSPLYERLISGVVLLYEASGEANDGHLIYYQPGHGTSIDNIASPRAHDQIRDMR